MATMEDVAEVRRMADEPEPDTYSDETLLLLLAANADRTAAVAAHIWQTKAGKYAKLVNTSESGSSRNNSELHKNALTMAKYYADIANPPVVAPTQTAPMTIDITR